MWANYYWLYSSIEDLIDMDVDTLEIEEEITNDRTDTTSFGNGAPESSTNHTE